ncbi:hypothetical protein BaRGS_00033299 [Batillaria attramentaria]|uniref:Prokaryotic-type class I peptide chain release factors domain-containing protein n=1 Tax=Batillaria attramentaria TaxID=370345 RepID=A0ABD0JLC1_9CAEN
MYKAAVMILQKPVRNRLCFCKISTITRGNVCLSSLHRNPETNPVQVEYHKLSSSIQCQHSVPSSYLGSHPTQCQVMLPISGHPPLTRNYVSRKTYQFPEILDEDLEEDFVRGSGPGGQSVNQTANCVVLKHKPTGIVVKCHETRSLEKNRERARERLQERLDLHLHGKKSFLSLQEQENSLQRQEKKKRNKVRLEMKKAFKEREGLD